MSLNGQEEWETLAPHVRVRISREHRFNTDTILLAHFSMPGKGELCADLGTGCGTIPLFWCGRAQPARVWGIELQEDAAALLQESVRVNGLESVLTVIPGDLRDISLLRSYMEPGSLDRMACNPPYTPAGKGSLSPEDSRRLARHQSACSFGDIARTAKWFLRWGGRFCCCQRPEHLAEVISLLRENGLEPKRLRLVQQRPDKQPFLFLLESLRGGRPGMQVLPTLLIQREPGILSQEMEAIYGPYRKGRRNSV